MIWNEIWIAVIDESGEISSVPPAGGEVEDLLVGKCRGEPVEQQGLGAFTRLGDMVVSNELPNEA